VGGEKLRGLGSLRRSVKGGGIKATFTLQEKGGKTIQPANLGRWCWKKIIEAAMGPFWSTENSQKDKNEDNLKAY